MNRVKAAFATAKKICLLPCGHVSRQRLGLACVAVKCSMQDHGGGVLPGKRALQLQGRWCMSFSIVFERLQAAKSVLCMDFGCKVTKFFPMDEHMGMIFSGRDATEPSGTCAQARCTDASEKQARFLAIGPVPFPHHLAGNSRARIHRSFALPLSPFTHHGGGVTSPGGHTCPTGGHLCPPRLGRKRAK